MIYYLYTYISYPFGKKKFDPFYNIHFKLIIFLLPKHPYIMFNIFSQ